MKVQIRPGETIETGSPITSSTLPGIGQIATKAGKIVGMSLGTLVYSTSGCTAISDLSEATWPEDPSLNNTTCFLLPDGTVLRRVMMFINISWYDPNPITESPVFQSLMADYEAGLLGGGVDTSTISITYDAVTANTMTATSIIGTSGIFNSLSVGTGFTVTTEGDVSISGDLILGANTISSEVNLLTFGSDIDVQNLYVNKIFIKDSNTSDGSAGSIIFTASETWKRVDSTAINIDSLVFTSIKTSTTGNYNVYITDQGDGYFEIELNTPVSNDLEVNWWVVN